MDHDTKPTHYEPPGFEPTPRPPKAGCLSTMVLLRCGYSLPTPHPSDPTVAISGCSSLRILMILGVRTPDERNRHLLPCHWTILDRAVASHQNTIDPDEPGSFNPCTTHSRNSVCTLQGIDVGTTGLGQDPKTL